MARAYNFSSGPAVLPAEVLEEAQRNLVEHPPFGMSVMEMSHRSKGWLARLEEIVSDIRRLGSIGPEWEVLFLQGGASLQFAMVPLNLLAEGESADYILTDSWSEKALKEAQRVGKKARAAASSKETKYDRIPERLDLDTDAKYVHYTSNNTIAGTQFRAAPATARPLVCDASSDIFSRPLDLTNHDLVYAGAQKNLGPAGVTLVLVRRDVLDRAGSTVPTMLTYKVHAENQSQYNTPPVFAIYMLGLVVKWLLRSGGLPAIEERNRAKAALLYDSLDGSSFYTGHAQRESRSWMNVPFRLPTEELDAAFVAAADKAGLKTLKGHKSVGGCRASIYNAMPIEGVRALVEFMREFERTHG